ncbi:MAG TPA: alpha/beta hydrolase-fold protein [Bacteroidota bacterium]|nr:alpha/beta hydrolase-fold protein [Bacteroidota bacterium]
MMSSTSHCGIVLVLGAAFLLCSLQHSFAQVRVETGFLNRTVEIAGTVYKYQVYVPSTYSQAQTWPVILFLHGAGERGNDGLLQTQTGLGTAIRQNAARYPAIVVFPQCPPDSIWVGEPSQAAMAALQKTLQEFKTDANRVYLTGLSMGGNGTWYLAYRHPESFAAVVPICAWIQRNNSWVSKFEPVVPDNTEAAFATVAKKLARVPVWIFHGEADGAVPVGQSRQAAAALTAIGAPVQYTELPGTGHNSWDAAYGSEKFVAWLFEQRRGK